MTRPITIQKVTPLSCLWRGPVLLAVLLVGAVLCLLVSAAERAGVRL